jgi:hypothetical protein
MTIQTNFDLYICIVADHKNAGDQQHFVDAEQDPHHFDLVAKNDFLLDDFSIISDYSDDSSLESFDESEDHEAMIRYFVDNEMDDEDSDDDDDSCDDSLEIDSLLLSRCRRLRNQAEQQNDHKDIFSLSGQLLRRRRESDECNTLDEDSLKLTKEKNANL